MNANTLFARGGVELQILEINKDIILSLNILHVLRFLALNPSYEFK